MLAEKFILVLETIISRRNPDDESRVTRNSPHVPVELPADEFLTRRSGDVVRVEALLRSISPSHPREKPAYLELLSGVEDLPEDERAVLLLVAVEDLSYSAAAKVLNVSTEVVVSCLSRARERLHAEIEGRSDASSGNIVRLESPK
jgi:DNA-directed RNA polymerase specialized sigma24 family protein